MRKCYNDSFWLSTYICANWQDADEENGHNENYRLTKIYFYLFEGINTFGKINKEKLKW